MNEIDQLVGQRIRACRTMQGLSQSDLGDAVGVRFQQIQKYESGQNRVSASRLFGIAEALNVPISFFFEGVATADGQSGPANADARSKDEVPFDRQSLTLAHSFSQLSESQKAALLSMVRSMAEPVQGRTPEKSGV